MPVFTIEGLDEAIAALKSEWSAGVDALGRDLERDAGAAAQDGVDAAKASHPYTDRTGDLTEQSYVNQLASGAAMTWPTPYAGYVDQGTSRSKPYPFTPEARRVATASLQQRATYSVDDLCKKMNK